MLPQTLLLKDGRKVTLAHAVPADAADIVALLNRAGGESDYLSFGKNECWATVEGQARTIEAAQTHGFELIVKASVGQELAGLLTFFRSKKPRLLANAELAVAVLAKYWNCGIATRLIASGLAWARSAGVRKINLRVRSDNAPAIAVYRKLGFVEEGTIERAVYVNGEFHSEKCMGLLVDSS